MGQSGYAADLTQAQATLEPVPCSATLPEMTGTVHLTSASTAEGGVLRAVWNAETVAGKRRIAGRSSEGREQRVVDEAVAREQIIGVRESVIQAHVELILVVDFRRRTDEVGAGHVAIRKRKQIRDLLPDGIEKIRGIDRPRDRANTTHQGLRRSTP
jgi:hypothetical protein